MFLMDKYESYLHLRPFYKRDIVKISKQTDFAEFDVFFQKHPQFIRKIINLSRGHGIERISAQYSPEKSWQLFDESLALGETVCEELLSNAGELAEFAPGVLNTVRIPTFLVGDTVYSFHPHVRYGRRGDVEDNVSSGR